MLTTNGFEEEPPRPERRRRLLHEFLDLAETCLLSTGVVTVLACATLLLIRMLAR